MSCRSFDWCCSCLYESCASFSWSCCRSSWCCRSFGLSCSCFRRRSSSIGWCCDGCCVDLGGFFRGRCIYSYIDEVCSVIVCLLSRQIFSYVCVDLPVLLSVVLFSTVFFIKKLSAVNVVICLSLYLLVVQPLSAAAGDLPALLSVVLLSLEYRVFTPDSIYAIAHICYRKSVCPSVCRSHGWISQKYHAIFTIQYLILVVLREFFRKF